MNFNDFVKLEQTNTDVIVTKKMYIDICGDIISGMLLSQIVYWHMPSKSTGVQRCGDSLVKKRSDWWNEIRLTPRQVDRAMSHLKSLGLIETSNHKSGFYAGATVQHITLNKEELVDKIEDYLNEGVILESPNGETVAETTEKPIADYQTVILELPNGDSRNDVSLIPSITKTITKNTNKDYNINNLNNLNAKNFDSEDIADSSFSSFFPFDELDIEEPKPKKKSPGKEIDFKALKEKVKKSSGIKDDYSSVDLSYHSFSCIDEPKPKSLSAIARGDDDNEQFEQLEKLRTNRLFNADRQNYDKRTKKSQVSF